MVWVPSIASYCFFFFNDTATTEIYTLSLHDALPIWARRSFVAGPRETGPPVRTADALSRRAARDRKSTRLNSSHSQISYAVFCLKKKNNRYPYSPGKVATEPHCNPYSSPWHTSAAAS